MFLFVICFNCVLALLNLWVAIRLLYYRRQIQRFSQYCCDLERCAQNLLPSAPAALNQLADTSHQLKLGYSLLIQRWQTLQKALILLRTLRFIRGV